MARAIKPAMGLLETLRARFEPRLALWEEISPFVRVRLSHLSYPQKTLLKNTTNVSADNREEYFSADLTGGGHYNLVQLRSGRWGEGVPLGQVEDSVVVDLGREAGTVPLARYFRDPELTPAPRLSQLQVRDLDLDGAADILFQELDEDGEARTVVWRNHFPVYMNTIRTLSKAVRASYLEVRWGEERNERLLQVVVELAIQSRLGYGGALSPEDFQTVKENLLEKTPGLQESFHEGIGDDVLEAFEESLAAAKAARLAFYGDLIFLESRLPGDRKVDVDDSHPLVWHVSIRHIQEWNDITIGGQLLIVVPSPCFHPEEPRYEKGSLFQMLAGLFSFHTDSGSQGD